MNPRELVTREMREGRAERESERDHIISLRGGGGVSHSREGKFNEIEIKMKRKGIRAECTLHTTLWCEGGKGRLL